MKNQIHFILFFIICFSLFSQNDRKVLIIGMDGTRSDALQLANTPNIDNLIANGIYSPDALNDDRTWSGPGWSAILTSVWSDKHLVTNNNFSGNDYANYPSLFKHIEDVNPSLQTASICHWNPINDEIVQTFADYKLNVATDAEVSSNAISYVTNNNPDLLFLHFDDGDHAGHGSGFSPSNPAYITAIETIDTYIGSILTAIEARTNYANEDWLILVTSDHGGLGTSHGGNSIEEQNVVVIASGNTIDQELIEKEVTIINRPFNCLYESAELEFDGANDFVQIPNNALFDFGANQDFTIECRVRTESAGDVAIIGNKDWNSGVNKGFVFSFKYPSGPEWKVNIGDGSNRTDINTGGMIVDNEWHTLSVTFDRDGLMSMYQDGVFVDSESISNVGDITTGEGLFFGTDINNAFDFSGLISEVRVWNTVIDAATINTWQCTTIDNTHPNYSDLLGYWELNQNDGTQAFDSSINAVHGTINNAVWDETQTIEVSDYSNTPRIADIAVTALTYLCIPIDSNWDFDGVSLIPVCNTLGLNENSMSTLNLELFPNPVMNELHVKLNNIDISQLLKLEIYQIQGSVLYEDIILNNEAIIDVSDFASGLYFVSIVTENKRVVKKLIKI